MSHHHSHLPSHMRAVVFASQSSSPFRFVNNFPVPKVTNPTDILVKVHAAGLNPVDFKIALYNWVKIPTPSIIGYDFSGTVVAVGSAVSDYKVGHEVFGNIQLTTTQGAFAEYAIVTADTITLKPDAVGHVDAASLGVAFLSAYDGFRQVQSAVNANTTVFVAGATGGVGHFAVQLFKSLGAKVAASSSGDEGRSLLKDQLKVDTVFDYKEKTFVEDVRKWAGGEGVDIVFDPTCQPAGFLQTAAMLKEGGQWVVLGSSYGKSGSAETKAVEERKGKVVGCDLGRYSFPPLRSEFQKTLKPGLDLAASLIGSGKLFPWINKVIQIEEIIREEQLINTGKGGNGKTVVKIVS